VSYFDTSVVAAYYCPEPLSEEAESALRAESDPAISHLVELELFSAVSRKAREGSLEQPSAHRVLGLFAEHLAAGYYQRLAVDTSNFMRARDWIGTLSLNLRTLDALHLSVAAANGLTVVTADRTLAGAAAELGIEARLIGR
jgi:predicted nucleic acid-binding protein